MKLKFKFYSDPGHGWLAVKRDLLKMYDVLVWISPYSYQKGGTVYLEEDSDLSKFLNVLRDNKVEFELIEKSTNKRSPIRSYESFKA